MQNLKTLRTRTGVAISFVLVIALVIGIAAVKLVSGNSQTNEDFGFTAETVSEGILLTFSNIPSDTIRLWVYISYYDSENNFASSYADIRDSSFPSRGIHSAQLDKVKQTGKIIFPIVNSGQKYTISATIENRQDHELMLNENLVPNIIYTEIIARNGINFDRNIKLELDETNSSVTLSSEVIFSSDVIFDIEKYYFAISINAENEPILNISVPSQDDIPANGLTWAFDPKMTEAIKEKGYLAGDNYPAYVTAYSNIIYNDIKWTIEIAKTPEFIYSL